MSDLRVYGFSIQVENQDGTTKVKQFRRAVSDLDGTVDLLNSTMGDNVTVTAQVTQTEKEAVAQARLLVQQHERQRRKTREVVSQYTTLNNTIRQYGNDAETVNAITRLGSNATEAQKQQVAELVAEYQRLRNQGDGTRNSMRNLRGVAQNLGWQLQDVAVQWQMGTDRMVIFAQQGSQMAAAFGPIGAIIGAGIAVAGAALPSLIAYLDETAVSTDQLKESTEKLNELFESGKYSIDGYTDELVKLYQADRQLAELKIIQGIVEAEKVMRSAQQELTSYSKELLNFTNLTSDNQYAVGALNARFSTLQTQLGLNREQVIQLHNAYQGMVDGGSADQFVNLIRDMALNTPGASAELKELALQVADAGIQSDLAQQKLEMLRSILSGSVTPTTKDASKYTESLAERYERLRRQLTMTDRQVEIDNFLRLEAVNLTQEQASVTQRALISYLDERDAINARNAAIEQSQALDEARIKQRESLLKPIEQDLTVTSSNPVEAEIQKNQQTMQTLQAQLSATKQYEYSERARINDLIEKEEQRHTDALFQSQLMLASNNVAIIGQTANFMSSLTNELFDGGEKMREAMENMNGWQKAMFFTTRAVAAAEALINGISLGGKLAEMFPLAAPAMVAFGTGLGAANAGAIAGTTFAGAFDDGGYIPSGMTGIVSEYGDELVNGQLVTGPARVTSREDTAKMMNGGSLNVSVINNAPGVEHKVNQIDEKTVEIIATKVLANNIDAAAAGVIGKKGTRTNRALTSKYDVRNKY